MGGRTLHYYEHKCYVAASILKHFCNWLLRHVECCDGKISSRSGGLLIGVEEKGHLSGKPPNMKFGPCVNVNSQSLSESELNRGEGLFRIRGISVVLFRGVSTTLLLVLEQEDMDWQIWEVLLVAETPDSEG